MFFGVLLIGLPISMIISGVIYLPIYYILHKRKLPKIRHFAIYGLCCCLMLIFFATIFLGGINFQPEYHFLNLKPFIWLTETYSMGLKKMASQLVLNVLMFVPLSILLSMVFLKLRSFGKSTLCVLVLTLFIEIFQYFTGRSADIDDVITNVLGGMLGFLIFTLCHRLFQDKQWWKKLLGQSC